MIRQGKLGLAGAAFGWASSVHPANIMLHLFHSIERVFNGGGVVGGGGGKCRGRWLSCVMLGEQEGKHTAAWLYEGQVCTAFSEIMAPVGELKAAGVVRMTPKG